MEFTQQILLSLSLMILAILSIYTFINRKVLGARPFLIQTVVTMLWTFASLMEFNSYALENKVFWRNIQQIGIFIGPIANLFFAIEYSNQARLRKFAYVVMLVPLTALLLIFTDSIHHIMRVGVTIGENDTFGRALIVQSTPIGRMFVVFNFCLPIFSIIILVNFMRRVTTFYRKRLLWIIVSLILLITTSWLRLTVFEKNGIYIPGAVLFTPSALILFFSIFRYEFFRLSPVARDKVFNIMNEGILVTDVNHRIIDHNVAAVNLLTQRYKGELLGASLAEVFVTESILIELAASGEEKEVELPSHTNPNQFITYRVYPLGMKEGHRMGTVIVMNDTTAKKRYELLLKEKAYRDGLTGLYNRIGFQNRYSKIFEHMNHDDYISILMLDIDWFKRINDTHGHITGDRVLQHLSIVLESVIGTKSSLIGRFGGEEFSVILPRVQEEEAYQIAESLRREVEQSYVETTSGNEVQYTISVGVSSCIQAEAVLETIMHEADVALYQAKQESRNKTLVYSKLGPNEEIRDFPVSVV